MSAPSSGDVLAASVARDDAQEALGRLERSLVKIGEFSASTRVSVVRNSLDRAVGPAITNAAIRSADAIIGDRS